MRVFVFVNKVCEIGFRQTTALLIASFYRKGCQVYLANVDGLSVLDPHAETEPHANTQGSSIGLPITSPGFFAKSINLKLNESSASSEHVAAFASGVTDADFRLNQIIPGDLVFVRTNPGRDTSNSGQHAAFLETCQAAQAGGICVLNNPARLDFFASKAAVLLLPPRFRPEMLITRDPKLIEDFVSQASRDCVIKPLHGSRGNDVIRLGHLSDIETELNRFQGRCVVVQHFVESEEPGDKRVVVLNGEILEHNEHVGGIHRIPADGEFRANLHAGGAAKPLALNDDERNAAQTAATLLHKAGIHLGGIDLIGQKVLEFNVFSTGGLYDANRFSGYDFSDVIASRLICQVASGKETAVNQES